MHLEASPHKKMYAHQSSCFEINLRHGIDSYVIPITTLYYPNCHKSFFTLRLNKKIKTTKDIIKIMEGKIYPIISRPLKTDYQAASSI